MGKIYRMVNLNKHKKHVVHYLASFVQQNSKIGGRSNPFGGSSITYVGSVCHQSRVIWRCGAHSALTSWSRWFYTVKWSKLAIFSGLSGRFLGVVWWFQSFLQVRTCPYLDDPEKFWKKNWPGWRRTPESGPHFLHYGIFKTFFPLLLEASR